MSLSDCLVLGLLLADGAELCWQALLSVDRTGNGSSSACELEHLSALQ